MSNPASKTALLSGLVEEVAQLKAQVAEDREWLLTVCRPTLAQMKKLMAWIKTSIGPNLEMVDQLVSDRLAGAQEGGRGPGSGGGGGGPDTETVEQMITEQLVDSERRLQRVLGALLDERVAEEVGRHLFHYRKTGKLAPSAKYLPPASQPSNAISQTVPRADPPPLAKAPSAPAAAKTAAKTAAAAPQRSPKPTPSSDSLPPPKAQRSLSGNLTEEEERLHRHSLSPRQQRAFDELQARKQEEERHRLAEENRKRQQELERQKLAEKRASDKAMQRAAAEKAEHDRREAERREAERHNDEKRAAAQPQRAAPRASSLLLSEDDPLAPPLQRLTQSDAAHSSAHDPLLESAGGDDELDEAAHEPLLDKAALERERRAEEALARTRAQQKAAPAAAAPAKDPLAALRARRNTGGPPPVATGGTAPGSVQQWLEQQGFSKYLTLFMEMGYDNLTIIRAMGGEDLEGMGITDRVEQRKILMGVSQLNTSARPPSQEIKVPASHLGSRAPASDSKATPTPTKQTSGLFDDDDLFNF